MKNKMADEKAAKERSERLCFTLFSNALGANFATRKWKEMLACLTSVDIGLKDAYLVDQCHVNASQMRALLQSLQTNAFLTNLDLKVVEICDDLFVVSKEKILQQLRDVSRQESGVLFIDVSENLSAPILLPDEHSWQSIRCFCDDFIQFLMEDNEHECVFPFQEKYSSACAIFGIILGYPVVYWSPLDNSRNCLSYQSLHVIAVTMRQWDQYYTVCSFSLPTSLLEISKTTLNAWRNKMKAFSENFTTVHLQISEKLLTLPAVVL